MSKTTMNNQRPSRRDLASRLGSFDDAPTPSAEDENSADPLDAIGSTEVFPMAGNDQESSEQPSAFDVLNGPAGDFKPEKAPRRRRLWIVPVAIVGLLGATYLGGVAAFSNVFLPGTTVDGLDVSLKDKTALAESIDSSTDGYALAISGDGVETTITAKDIDLGYDGEAYASQALAQTNPWSWPVALSQTRSIKLQKTVKYDASKVSAALDALVDQSKQAAEAAAEGASISYSAEKASFVLDNGGDTRYLDADALNASVTAALDALKPSLTLGEDLLTGGDDYSQALSAANAYLAAAPTLTLAGTQVGTVSPDQIASWLRFDDELKVELDEAALTKWAQGDLSQQLDTVGTTRTYTRPDGKAVSVSGGTYGWNIDGAALASQIVSDLQSGTSTTIEVPTKSAAAAYAPGGKDWGNRFIDIDLTEQHVRMYDASGALVWESDCVSGDSGKGHDTPCGVYTMDSYRASGNVELRGAIDPSTNEPEYISKVQYWMPFIGNSYALHDADWRSNFGGNIYTYNGSHGCVNLPSSKAAELYNLTSVGDVVVVHT